MASNFLLLFFNKIADLLGGPVKSPPAPPTPLSDREALIEQGLAVYRATYFEQAGHLQMATKQRRNSDSSELIRAIRTQEPTP